MRPASFEFQEPQSVDAVCAALAEQRGEVAVLAGGQSLVPQLNTRQRTPALVLGICGIAELNTVTVSDGRLRIGAAVTQRALQRSEPASAVPVLGAALGHVGHVPTRNRGTLGGSIAYADPTGELPLVLLALGGAVVARSTGSARTIPAGELFTGPFRTALRRDELLTAVELPLPGPDARWAFEQRDFRRHAKVSAVAGHHPGSGLVVAVAGGGHVPVLVPDADSGYRRGGAAAVATAAAELVIPIADRYGSVGYRRRLVRLAVADAVARVTDDPARSTSTGEDVA